MCCICSISRCTAEHVACRSRCLQLSHDGSRRLVTVSSWLQLPAACKYQLHIAQYQSSILPNLCCACCRLPEVQAARTLAGRDSSEADASFTGRPYVAPAQPGPSSAHFVAECFFLTQRVIHTCLLPAGQLFTASAHVNCCFTFEMCTQC